MNITINKQLRSDLCQDSPASDQYIIIFYTSYLSPFRNFTDPNLICHKCASDVIQRWDHFYTSTGFVQRPFCFDLCDLLTKITQLFFETLHFYFFGIKKSQLKFQILFLKVALKKVRKCRLTINYMEI